MIFSTPTAAGPATGKTPGPQHRRPSWLGCALRHPQSLIPGRFWPLVALPGTGLLVRVRHRRRFKTVAASGAVSLAS